jgi:hypothetical protein
MNLLFEKNLGKLHFMVKNLMENLNKVNGIFYLFSQTKFEFLNFYELKFNLNFIFGTLNKKKLKLKMQIL